MSEIIHHEEHFGVDDNTPISSDVLNALEMRKNASMERFSDIDESLASMEKEVSKKLEMFLGKTSELELSEIAMYNPEAPSALLGQQPVLARIDGDEDQLLICFCMASPTFRNLLTVTLGGKNKSASDDLGLTFAERKIFTRFVDQLMSGYFEILDSISDIGIPRKPYVIDIQTLHGILAKTELVSVTFELDVAGEKQAFAILAPLEVLEPAKSSKPDETEIERKLEADRKWSETLKNSVETMEVPLRAQAASIEMALSEISDLKVGQSLNLTLNSGGVRFLDADGNFTFLTDIVFQKNQIRLRVVDPCKQVGR